MKGKAILPGFVLVMGLTGAHAVQHANQGGDTSDGTILMGEHYAFILKPPAGWTLDTEAGKRQGVQAVVYPAGSSWKEATAVMYARVIYKDRKRPTAKDVIDSDIKDFAAMDKDSVVSSMPSVRTRDEKEATVKHFYDAHNRNEEAIAYIDEPRVVIILALSSRIKEEYSRSLDAFRSLVRSYFLVKELVGSGGGNTRAFFGLEDALAWMQSFLESSCPESIPVI